MYRAKVSVLRPVPIWGEVAMQVGDVYEHPVRKTRIVIVSPHAFLADAFTIRIEYSDGYSALDTCVRSDETVWASRGYIKHPAKENSTPELSSGPDGMSCRYDSPKTPQEEEEDYRKKRDAIFARMFS